MATTSYLYHAMNLVGYVLRGTEYVNGWTYFEVERAAHKRTCRNCGAGWPHLTLEGQFERTFFGLPVGNRKQFVVLRGHRQECAICGATAREPIPFAEGSKRYLKTFGRFVVELCRLMPIKYVAWHLGVSWDLVKEIYEEHLQKRFAKRRLVRIRYIAVDEFATHKGQRYMTVVMDLETGAVLHAAEGRGAAALVPFLERLKRAHVPLKAVAMDMSEAYAKAVRQVFGDKVDIVHDPYHVVALANEAIDETRRDMVRELQGDERKALKGTRFLLLKGLENLKQSSLGRLAQLMEVNEPLYQGYLLKEELRTFWSLPDAGAGAAFLDDWTRQARATELKHFRRLADTLDSHRPGLLAYFRHRLSTGPLEGLNNKIKVLKRQAYGFRDMAFFKLRLYFIHEAACVLPG